MQPQVLHFHKHEALASLFLSADDDTIDPMDKDSSSTGMYDCNPISIVLTVQAGCQYSGWKFVNVSQILVFTSNLPFGVKN